MRLLLNMPYPAPGLTISSPMKCLLLVFYKLIIDNCFQLTSKFKKCNLFYVHLYHTCINLTLCFEKKFLFFLSLQLSPFLTPYLCQDFSILSDVNHTNIQWSPLIFFQSYNPVYKYIHIYVYIYMHIGFLF